MLFNKSSEIFRSLLYMLTVERLYKINIFFIKLEIIRSSYNAKKQLLTS